MILDSFIDVEDFLRIDMHMYLLFNRPMRMVECSLRFRAIRDNHNQIQQ